MPTHTIKPAGGGDYTTLQAWETAVDGMAADTYIAECYTGGNLGSVDIKDVTVGSILKIEVAAGHEHNGDVTAGAYVTSSSDYVTAVYLNASNVSVKGLRITVTNQLQTCIGSQPSAAASPLTGVLIDGCLCITAPVSVPQSIGVRFAASANVTLTAEARNNIIVTGGTPSTQNVAAMVSTANSTFSAFNAVLNASFFNNTIIGNGKVAKGFEVSSSRFGGAGFSTNTTVVRNNVIIGPSVTCFNTATVTAPNTASVTSSNNASSDSTADWAGGSGHVENIVAANEFATPASDWSLKAGSSLLEAGFNLSGTFTNDAYENTRVVPWNIGAWGGTFVVAPVANFSGTPLSDVVPLTVVFTDSSSNTPTSWLWDFGDASSDTVQNPSHTYLAEGTYTVTLTATNAGGSDGETKAAYIIVLPATPDAAVRIGLGLSIGL